MRTQSTETETESAARPAATERARAQRVGAAPRLLAAGALLCALGGGCSGTGGTSNQPTGDGGTGGDMLGSNADMTGVDPEAQRPAQIDETAIDAWLKTGKYKQWRCESAVVTTRGVAHSQRSRVCSNDALIKASGAPYPVNATSVLELYDSSNNITGYAFSIRTLDGDGGQNRFWYEQRGTTITGGQAEPVCTSCHINATNDYTYLRAP